MRRLLPPVSALVLLLAAFSLPGCFSYAARLTLFECALSADVLVQRIEPLLSARGFAPLLERIDDSGPEYDHHIVAEYYLQGRSISSHRVWVIVTVEKTSGRAGVLVRDLDSSKAGPELLALEKSISVEIEAASAGCRIERAAETWGPGFGP